MDTEAVLAAYRRYVSDSFDQLLRIDADGTPWALFAATHFSQAVGRVVGRAVVLPDYLGQLVAYFSTARWGEGRLLGGSVLLTHKPAADEPAPPGCSAVNTADAIRELRRRVEDAVAAVRPDSAGAVAAFVLAVPPVGFRQFYLGEPVPGLPAEE